MALKTLSMSVFSYLDKSWEAMNAYVACFSLDEALKFYKFANAPIATSELKEFFCV